MKVNRKYINAVLALCFVEIMMVVFTKGLVASYSVVIFGGLSYGIFILRRMYCWNLMVAYVKDNSPALYEKNTTKMFNRRAVSQVFFSDKNVVSCLDSQSLAYLKEMRTLQKIMFLVFFVFGVSGAIIAARRMHG